MLPRFETAVAAESLKRPSNLGQDVADVLNTVQRLEARVVESTAPGQDARWEADSFLWRMSLRKICFDVLEQQHQVVLINRRAFKAEALVEGSRRVIFRVDDPYKSGRALHFDLQGKATRPNRLDVIQRSSENSLCRNW